MKKIVILLLCSLLMVGCGGKKESDVLKKFEEKLTSTENYTLEGMMEIKNNEEVYNYDVSVNYMKGDYYRVRLFNTETSHEQIILKNEDGVYV